MFDAKVYKHHDSPQKMLLLSHTEMAAASYPDSPHRTLPLPPRLFPTIDVNDNVAIEDLPDFKTMPFVMDKDGTLVPHPDMPLEKIEICLHNVRRLLKNIERVKNRSVLME